MKFSNRNGWLYVKLRGQREKSTSLRDTPANRKLVASHMKHDEFFEKFNVNKDVPTVLELCEEVLAKLEKKLKFSSYKAYASAYKYWIVPHFNKRVSEIEPIHIYEWYEKFTGRSTLMIAEAVIKPAFEMAILRKYIKTTPLVISKPTIKSEYEIQPFTIEEMKALLSTKSKVKNFLGISMFTGLRSGEMFGLKWSDIDFQEMTIDIRRNVYQGVIQTPKTQSSMAKIDLPVEAEPYFRDQQFKTGLKEFVFYNANGTYIKSPATINYPFKELLKQLKIKDRGIHQTRHTFASQKLSMGGKIRMGVIYDAS